MCWRDELSPRRRFADAQEAKLLDEILNGRRRPRKRRQEQEKELIQVSEKKEESPK